MKLLMEQWRKFLKEGISDVVYHYTNGLEKGAKILEQNRFMASGGFTKDVESELGKGKLYYFSTARTPANAYTGTYPQGVIFKLDGRALAQKYKGVPLTIGQHKNAHPRRQPTLTLARQKVLRQKIEFF